jgi:DNA-binding MarR family transcriptional regulator
VRRPTAPAARKKSRANESERAEGRVGTDGVVEGRPARPVLFGPLTDYLGYALRRAQMSSVTGFLDSMKEVDLRPTQFAVLILIHQNPGVRQTEVCAALGLQKANFVPLLNELQRRDLAIRKAGVPDRRASALHLTEHGEAVLQRASELHTQWEERLVARLGVEGRDRLLELLKKLM